MRKASDISDELHIDIRNEYHKTALNLFFTSNWLTGIHNRALKEFGITIQQHNILRILKSAHPNPCTIGTIKKGMIERLSDVSRVVDNMKKKKLINRYHSEEDRRVVHVYITDKGLTILKSLEEVNDYLDNCVAHLSVEETKQLNYLLNKLRGEHRN